MLDALGMVQPGRVQLSNLRYDGRPMVPGHKYQERAFAYEFYHQLRLLQEAGRADLQGFTQQGEVSKTYQGVPYAPDLLVHVPGDRGNLAAFEFKLATNLDLGNDLFKLQHLKADYGYINAFMVILGSTQEAERWMKKARGFVSSTGEEIDFIIYNPEGQDRASLVATLRVNVRYRRSSRRREPT